LLLNQGKTLQFDATTSKEKSLKKKFFCKIYSTRFHHISKTNAEFFTKFCGYFNGNLKEKPSYCTVTIFGSGLAVTKI
jgi:hypothetical protein